MSTLVSDPVSVRNRILSTLAKTEYARLRPCLDQVALEANEVLYAPGDDVRYIHFPDNAVVSLLFDVDGRRTVEVAMEGNDIAVPATFIVDGHWHGAREVLSQPGRLELSDEVASAIATTIAIVCDWLHPVVGRQTRAVVVRAPVVG